MNIRRHTDYHVCRSLEKAMARTSFVEVEKAVKVQEKHAQKEYNSAANSDLVIIVLSGVLGELVARFYSEPANQRLRARFGDGPATLGSVVQPEPKPDTVMP